MNHEMPAQNWRPQFHFQSLICFNRMTSSPPPPTVAPPSESQLSSLIYDLSQNVNVAMDNMLKMINEIDQNCAGIMEEIEKSKESVVQRKIHLEEEKDHFQKAAFAVLDMLNNRDIS